MEIMIQRMGIAPVFDLFFSFNIQYLLLCAKKMSYNPGGTEKLSDYLERNE